MEANRSPSHLSSVRKSSVVPSTVSSRVDQRLALRQRLATLEQSELPTLVPIGRVDTACDRTLSGE